MSNVSTKPDEVKTLLSDEEVAQIIEDYPAKEHAIMMLADAIEAGSRTLKDPTVSRIRSMVDNLIQERLLDSELDESPLTMRELKKVGESFVNTLTGMFHGRVEYPQTETRTPKRTPKKAVDA